MQTQALDNGSQQARAPGRAAEWLDEVIAYLRSRGVAAKDDDGRLLRRIVEIPSESPESKVSVTKAAKKLYISRRALGRQCVRAGLPGPGTLLRFARVLSTFRVMRERRCPIGRAAQLTGWSDGLCFSQTSVRTLGLRPSAARGKDLLFLSEAWLQRELAAGTLVLRQPEPPPCPTCGGPMEFSFHPSTPTPSVP